MMKHLQKKQRRFCSEIEGRIDGVAWERVESHCRHSRNPFWSFKPRDMKIMKKGNDKARGENHKKDERMYMMRQNGCGKTIIVSALSHGSMFAFWSASWQLRRIM
jgi:hypothetical protein